MRKTIIFAKWKRKGDANPIQYSFLDQNLMKQFRASNCLFARKFPKDSVNVDTWLSLIQPNEEYTENCKTIDTSVTQINKKQKTS